MENVLYQGTGYAVVEIDGKMKICWAEGIEGTIKYYDITQELFERLKKSEKDANEVMFFCKNGRWLPKEDEVREAKREFLRNNPKLLLKIPSNQDYFEKEELEEILKKLEAEK
ncbi:hypothetical protein [Butyrivibrio sp. XPD2006]|jgi:hypothetical protein|uniref:hypothetical protein n=1 Tax=Butyrivibrio sp. XPD2006 TaxID=1280668 RepID=UPI0003B42D02|nr:hypothetical protein [Butyrivibrio sp. XPD2006]